MKLKLSAKVKAKWIRMKAIWLSLVAFYRILTSEKAGVLIVYDANTRQLDVMRHNLDVEGARDLTLLGLGVFNRLLFQKAARKVFIKPFTIHTN